jgi:hypothetical protein
MNPITFQERIITYTDWATLLFIMAFVIIAVNRNVFATRFYEFIRLAISDKFTKIYKDRSNMLSGFTISMFVVQLLSLSFFILLLLNQLGIKEKNDGIVYIQIITFLGVFILSKYLIEKIIATTFQFEEFIEQFNLLKVSYRTYLGFILLPINLILYYNTLQSDWIFIILTSLLVVFNALTYIIAIKIYQNLVIRKLFYFILYLCTLEIAPYYFMYYWITKN